MVLQGAVEGKSGAELSCAEKNKGTGVDDGDAGHGKLFLQDRVFCSWIKKDPVGFGRDDFIGHDGGVGGGDIHREGGKGVGMSARRLKVGCPSISAMAG